MSQYANLDDFFSEIENDIKRQEESEKLLRLALRALNWIPNTKLNESEVKDTYQLASMIGKFLKNEK